MSETFITIIGFSVIFIATALGAALVFAFKNELSERFNSLLIGSAAGIMLAASVWSLILPAIDGSDGYGALKFLPAAVGIIFGGLFLHLIVKLTAKLCAGDKADERQNTVARSLKTFIAITVHNIPEGLAVGFAFGAASNIGTYESYLIALGLAVGIAVQNLPEGAAVSLPLKKVVKNKFNAFMYGALSGIVEPIAAVVGYYLAFALSAFQPWFLSFAAGAMLFVAVDDLIPETKTNGNSRMGTWGVIAGFILMMILDVALG